MRKFGWMQGVLTMIAVAVLSASFVACGSDEDATPAKPTADTASKKTPAAPDAPATEVPEAEQPGAQVLGDSIAEEMKKQVEVPANYPADGPLYPGVKPAVAMDAPGDRINLMFGTQDSPADATKTIVADAESKGWVQETNQEMDGRYMVRFKKGERVLAIVTSAMGEGTDDQFTMVAVTAEP